MTTPTPEQIEAAVLRLKNATSKDHWPKIATMQVALTAKDARIKELEREIEIALNLKIQYYVDRIKELEAALAAKE